MLADSLLKAVNENILDLDLADKYLNLYVSDIEWKPHLASLWSNISSKNLSLEDKKSLMRSSVSSTILHPYLLKTKIPDPPSNLLFWTGTWKNFHDYDWFDLLRGILKEDIKISEHRNTLLQIGVIDPIDISPLTRQAFNWLYQKADESGSISVANKKDLITKYKNLVRAYGGAVICSVFSRHSLHVDKVLNWRSGYFFEREVHKAFSIEELLKIKQAEINKTNVTNVRKLGA